MNGTSSRARTRGKILLRTPATCTTILIVQDALGLHARSAAMLAKMAREYDSEIVLKCGRHSVNAKSMLGLLTLGAVQGARVGVTAEGRDARKAVRAIEDLFGCAFHEGGAAAHGTVTPIVGVGPTGFMSAQALAS